MNFDKKLSEFCARTLGQKHLIEELRRFTGGANMESWGFSYGPHKLVLRRFPEGFNQETALGISLTQETDVMKAATLQTVKCPKIIGTLHTKDALGRGFVMEQIAGETMPHKLLRDPKFTKAIPKLATQCANELVKIHSISITASLENLPRLSPREMILQLENNLRDMDGMTPVFEWALSWLLSNLPTPRDPVLLHGDFRMGNLMIDENGLASVLDWELAHIGDRAQDLAYLCTPSWRFGHYEKTVGGFADLDELLTHYEALTDFSIPVSDISFWMIYSSLNWGLNCLQMINFWRSGEDRSLERVVIGRRTSETEIDILLMLEQATDIEVKKFHHPPNIPAAPKGPSNKTEILSALVDWSTDNVIPNLKGHNLFQARVARNALGIVRRMTETGALHAREMSDRLNGLGLTNETLSKTLRNGDISEDIAAYLRRDLLGRVSIDQPKYAGLKAAIKKWTHEHV